MKATRHLGPAVPRDEFPEAASSAEQEDPADTAWEHRGPDSVRGAPGSSQFLTLDERRDKVAEFVAAQEAQDAEQ